MRIVATGAAIAEAAMVPKKQTCVNETAAPVAAVALAPSAVVKEMTLLSRSRRSAEVWRCLQTAVERSIGCC